MRKIVFVTIIINFIVSILILIVNRESIETITFFPLDDQITIEQAFTSLQATSMKDDQKILLNWDIQSKTKYPLYLRQDVSLLFINGYLLAVTNTWETDENIINQHQTFKIKHNNLLQSISFHHGEIHENSMIKSTQKMTYDQLYTVCCQSDTKMTTFKYPKTPSEEKITKILNESIDEQLHTKWRSLMEKYNVDEHDYFLIPLIELVKYNDEQLPNLSQEKTATVIGQLWEGLYKNYVLPLSEQKYSSSKNYMPLILFDRHATHLIVIYEINGQSEQLYQNIS